MSDKCPKCGAAAGAEARFCAQCGRNLGRPEGRAGEDRREGRAGAGVKLLLLLCAAGVFAWAFRGEPRGADGGMARPAVRRDVEGMAAMGGHGAAAIADPELKKLYDESQAAPGDLAKMRLLAQSLEDKLKSAPADQEGPLTMTAVEVFGRILKANPGDKEALLAMGAISSRHGVFDKAAGYYGRYLALAPDDAQARLGYAGALIGSGRAAEAKKELGAVLEKEPRSFQATLHLALAQAELGEQGASLESAQRAENLASTDMERAAVKRFIAELQTAKSAEGEGDPAPACTPDPQAP